MKACICLLLLFSSLSGFAQMKQGPPLLFEHLPKAGDMASYYYLQPDSMLRPGTGGANAKWEFLTILRVDKTDTINYISKPTGIPFKIFNDASFSMLNNKFPLPYIFLDEYFAVYSYYLTDSTGLYFIGNSPNLPIDSSTYGQFLYDSFQPPKNIMKVPFYFGDSVKSSSSLYGNYYTTPNGYHGFDSIAYSFSCDGFGSLNLPGALFDSVIRIHYNENYYQVPYGVILHGFIDKYCWYDVSHHGKGLRMPLFEIFNETDYSPSHSLQHGLQSLPSTSGFMLVSYKGDSAIPTTPYCIALQNDSKISVYYNAVTNSIVLLPRENIPAANWFITDMSGKRLLYGNTVLQIDVLSNIYCAGLKQGAYIFQINNNAKQFIIP